MLPVDEFSADKYLVMLTRNGQMKRTPVAQFSHTTSRGVSAMAVKAGDRLLFAALSEPTDSLMVTASNGMLLHFTADKLRPQSRLAGGIRVGAC